MYVYGCWTFFYSTGSNLGAIFLSQTNSSPSSGYKLTICPKLEHNYMSPSPLHAGILMWLICSETLSVQSPLLWVHVHNDAIMSEKYCFAEAVH